MGNITLPWDENLLVGTETMDDAGVYKLTEEIALVQTVDYITPVVDDPYLYGQVAAANSLSDIYAMGARPLTAMNLCNFPAQGVEKKILEAIMRGGVDKVREAGAIIVGGHTVKDEELKFGLSVTGIVHPKKVIRNSTAKPGDKLILTKPIGTGVLITAFKMKLIGEEVMTRVALAMAELNRDACEAMLEVGVNAATDITGFALAGHALEVANGSGVGLRLAFDAIPYYKESLELIRRGLKTGSTAGNKELTAGQVYLEDDISPEEEMLLYDPQTSGGLFISVPEEKAERLLGLLHKRGVKDAAIIGQVFASPSPRLAVGRTL